MHNQSDYVFLKIDALEWWKKIEIIYGDPKKLSSFKKAGKADLFQPNFSAATSLLRKKFIKSKL